MDIKRGIEVVGIEKNGKSRLYLLDEYRGFVIINMIAYHAIWDLVYMFGVGWKWYKSDIGFIWQQWICWSFILVSGFCWQMSQKNLKRGLLVFGAGFLITAVTVIFMPASKVVFGVLTLLGSSMLLMIPCDKICRKIPSLVGMIASFVIFLLVYPVNRGYLGIGEMRMVELPREWYANLFTTYLGFTEPGFYSTDYFSIVPWFFLYLTGYFLYSFMGKNCGATKLLTTSICSPLGWIGRHSLIIYMLHQPVIYGVLCVVLGGFV